MLPGEALVDNEGALCRDLSSLRMGRLAPPGKEPLPELGVVVDRGIAPVCAIGKGAIDEIGMARLLEGRSHRLAGLERPFLLPAGKIDGQVLESLRCLERVGRVAT